MESTTLSHFVNNNTCSLAAVAICPEDAQKRWRKQMRFWKQLYTIWDVLQCLKDTMSPKNELMICFQENPVMNFSHPWETHYQRCFPLQHVLKSGLLVASHLSVQAEILVLTLLTAKRNKKQFFLILPLRSGPRGLIPPSPRIHPSPQAWLADSEQPRRLHDQKYPLFSLIDSFSEIRYPTLRKANTMLIVFILKERFNDLKPVAKYAFL